MSRLTRAFVASLQARSLVLFCAVLILTSCTTGGLQPTVNQTPAAASAQQPTAILENPSPAATMTASISSATATTIAVTPNPGWVWYEEPVAPGVLFQLPEAWEV